MADRTKNTAQSGGAVAAPRATLVLLCVAAAIATGLALPWGLGAVAFIIPGFMVAIRGLNARPQERSARAGRLRVFFAVCLIVLTGLSMVASVRVAFYPTQAGLERCVTDTVTQAGLAECREQLQQPAP